jgi:large subunit ribosomal protein L27e
VDAECDTVLLQEAKKLFEEKFKSGKNRWFFTKLRF